MSNNPSITHISTPTNGVVHVRISLDLSHLTDESDLRHLPFALMLLNKVGDKHISTTDLEILEKMCCSGVEMGVSPFEKCISDGNHFKNVCCCFLLFRIDFP